MSQQNVDRFMEATEAFNVANVEAFLDLVDPEIQYEPVQAALQGAYVGHEGVREWFADVSQHYIADSWEVSYTDVRDLGEAVLGIGTLRFTAAGSGISSETTVAFLATFRDGLMVRLKDHGDRRRAFQAAGLSE